MELAASTKPVIVLMDGARYHTSQATRDCLGKLGVPHIYSGPYSYAAAPIEHLFAAVKRGRLMPADDPTGKK